MLTKRIVPCLDVKGGRVVKGVKFIDLVDKGDPAEHARRYDLEGADEITLLDITATTEGRRAMLDVVRRTADQIFTPLTVGGGVKTEGDIEALLEAGADKVSVNSAAVADPDLIERCAVRWGSQAIVVAIDVKLQKKFSCARENASENAEKNTNELFAGWEVLTHGGRTPTAMDACTWAARVADLGAGEILLTSMDRDGTRDGYDIALLQAVTRVVSVPVIASGGAGELEHLREAFVLGHASAVLAASVFHDGTYRIGEAKRFLADAGLPVRLLGEQRRFYPPAPPGPLAPGTP